MVTGNLIHLGPVGTNSEQTYFVQAPFACHLHDVQVTAQNSDIGDADTVVVSNGIGGTTIGTATFGSTIAAGAKATYVAADANQEIAKDGIIQVVVSALDASGDRVFVTLELDPYRLES
jgi:hypothetical protein